MGKTIKTTVKSLLAAAFGVCTLAGAQAATREEASFTSLDGSVISAVVFRPAGQGAVGTVVVLHGCDCVYTSASLRSG